MGHRSHGMRRGSNHKNLKASIITGDVGVESEYDVLRSLRCYGLCRV